MQVSVASTIEAFGSDARNRPFPCELEEQAYRAFEWLYSGAVHGGLLRAAVLP
jgi:hypothetical protein